MLNRHSGGENMAKKAKKKLHKMPPLSFVDRLIYWTLGLMLLAADVALVLFPFWHWYRNAFRDETVLASHMSAGILWAMIPWFVFMISTFSLWYSLYSRRLPIFGKRNFKYGPPAWPKIYPLFMKNKPYVWVSQRSVKNRRQTAILLLSILLLSFLFYPLSWSGRSCLHQNGSIRKYNALNIQAREHTSGQIQQIRFEAYLRHRRRSLDTIADIRVILITDDGKRYMFDHDEFRGCSGNSSTDWLSAMVDIKGRYRPEIITYLGASNLEKVILDNRLSSDEQTMLYRLFETERTLC
jgi:hypothetical protein